jgi:hypothetical protein
MKSMSAMASPFIDGWNCCNTTGKNFLPIPTSREKATARLSLLLEMHESGHARDDRVATRRCSQKRQALDSGASSVIVTGAPVRAVGTYGTQIHDLQS